MPSVPKSQKDTVAKKATHSSLTSVGTIQHNMPQPTPPGPLHQFQQMQPHPHFPMQNQMQQPMSLLGVPLQVGMPSLVPQGPINYMSIQQHQQLQHQQQIQQHLLQQHMQQQHIQQQQQHLKNQQQLQQQQKLQVQQLSKKKSKQQQSQQQQSQQQLQKNKVQQKQQQDQQRQQQKKQQDLQKQQEQQKQEQLQKQLQKQQQKQRQQEEHQKQQEEQQKQQQQQQKQQEQQKQQQQQQSQEKQSEKQKQDQLQILFHMQLQSPSSNSNNQRSTNGLLQPPVTVAALPDNVAKKLSQLNLLNPKKDRKLEHETYKSNRGKNAKDLDNDNANDVDDGPKTSKAAENTIFSTVSESSKC